MNQLSQLLKALSLANDQGLTTRLFIQVLVAPVVASISAPGARIHVVMVASEVVKTIILVLTPEVGQSATIGVDFSIRELLPYPSPAKRGRGDSLSTPFKGGAAFVEGEFQWLNIASHKSQTTLSSLKNVKVTSFSTCLFDVLLLLVLIVYYTQIKLHIPSIMAFASGSSLSSYTHIEALIFSIARNIIPKFHHKNQIFRPFSFLKPEPRKPNKELTSAPRVLKLVSLRLEEKFT
ncbi:unnamed protein product [Vicia faba]|uniref:Uncharacterized protein n=1 Tax=Vicia faba TaxID=3906 RepID=A0AAV1ADI2_VICFA|nr:unnamed protein product [Vicia faba]